MYKKCTTSVSSPPTIVPLLPPAPAGSRQPEETTQIQQSTSSSPITIATRRRTRQPTISWAEGVIFFGTGRGRDLRGRHRSRDPEATITHLATTQDHRREQRLRNGKVGPDSEAAAAVHHRTQVDPRISKEFFDEDPGRDPTVRTPHGPGAGKMAGRNISSCTTGDTNGIETGNSGDMDHDQTALPRPGKPQTEHRSSVAVDGMALRGTRDINLENPPIQCTPRQLARVTSASRNRALQHKIRRGKDDEIDRPVHGPHPGGPPFVSGTPTTADPSDKGSTSVSSQDATDSGSSVEKCRPGDQKHPQGSLPDISSTWSSSGRYKADVTTQGQRRPGHIHRPRSPREVGSGEDASPELVIAERSEDDGMKLRRRLARIFGLKLGPSGFSGDPWAADLHENHDSWPLHLFDARFSQIATQVIVSAAEKHFGFADAMSSDMRLAAAWLVDERFHVVHQADIHSITAAFGIPPGSTPHVKKSRFSLEQLRRMEEHAIVAIDVQDDSHRPTSVFGFLSPEPQKSPPRNRVIFDTLYANSFSLPLAKTQFRSLPELLAFFKSHRWFVCFDFRAFYYQFALSPEVSRHYIGRISGSHSFRLLRPAMGHKNTVFVAQVVSSALARLAKLDTQSVQSDVIIDNVCFAGNDLEEMYRVVARFRSMCSEANVVVGEETEISQVVTHRGVTYDSRSGLLRVKNSWRDKFLQRLEHLVRRPTFDRLRSILGMLAYLRIYFHPRAETVGPRLPSTFFLWKTCSRWLAAGTKRRLAFAPCVIHQLIALKEFLESDPAVNLVASDHLACEDEFLVTDAARDSIFAGWGAVLVRGARVSVAGGSFPLATPEPIAILEMRAVGLAISYWQYDLRRRYLQVLTDNTASLFALRKGYSPSWLMNEELIHISEILARQGLRIVVDFIPSKVNPADDPSRGVYTIDDAKLTEARRIAAEAKEGRQRTSPRSLGECWRRAPR